MPAFNTAENTLSSGLILVTGARGFIGSAVIAGLNAQGHTNIIACDHLVDYTCCRNLFALKVVDYICAEALLETLERKKLPVKTIFHLGACSSTQEPDTGYLLENNFTFTKDLAHWALENGARFIYASSAATYGMQASGTSECEEALHQFVPMNGYAYSKHLFDCYARAQGFLQKIVGLKYFNIFGPNEYHKENMQSVVCKAFHQIQTTGKATLFKSHKPDYRDGEQKRDFLYIKDAVQMTLYMAQNPHTGGLYNIGAGVANTFVDFITPIFHCLKKPVKIEFIDMPESLRNQYQYETQANIGKLLKSGYTTPITPLKNAVTDYVTNYLMKNAYLTAENFS